MIPHRSGSGSAGRGLNRCISRLARCNPGPPAPFPCQPVIRSKLPVQARMHMHVGVLVPEDLRQFVTDDEILGKMFLHMVILAKQEAIGTSCAAYDLHQKRMVALMFRTLQPLSEGVDNEAAGWRHDPILPARFCARADHDRMPAHDRRIGASARHFVRHHAAAEQVDRDGLVAGRVGALVAISARTDAARDTDRGRRLR